MVSHHHMPANAKAPLNGAFPLDTIGLCKHLIQKYLKTCTHSVQHEDVIECRNLMKEYLECRVKNKLI